MPTFPALVRWAPGDLPLVNRSIAARAIVDCGICEIPPGSNRSPVIDHYNEKVGVPAGSFWCASAVSAWFHDAGANHPGKFGSASCDQWMAWAKKNGSWSTVPVIGAAVLYGVPGDAQHIGVIVRVTPILLSVEGNRAFAGYSRNGVAVDLGPATTSRILGYVHPTAVTGSI